MASIEIRRSHDLDSDRVRSVVEQIALDLRSRLGGNYRWQGDVLEFSRTGASGRIRVDDREVEVRVQLGLLLRPMKTTIESAIRRYLEENLA